MPKRKYKRRNPKPPNRNEPCPCGSGKKYKHCCLAKKSLPSLRKRGTKPVVGDPASPVGGELVLMCVHTGIRGHVDPTKGIGTPPFNATKLVFYWADDPIEGIRPDGSTYQANWIALCKKCDELGVERAPITGDYLWPDEPPDSVPVIDTNLPQSRRKHNPTDIWDQPTQIVATDKLDYAAIKDVLLQADWNQIATLMSEPMTRAMKKRVLRKVVQNDPKVDAAMRRLIDAIHNASEEAIIYG